MIMHKHIRYIVSAVVLLSLYSCASQGYPKGGELDKSPPLLRELLPPMNSTAIGENTSI